MKLGAFMLGSVVLCLLPAGAETETDPAPTILEVRTLTRIDAFPTKDEVVIATGDVVRLRELAMVDTVDFGLQLRAIRTLPHFCTPNCKPNTATQQIHPAHAAVLEVIQSVGGDRSGHGILRLRAGIEALGLVRSGVDSDVSLLVPFLDDGSRDIRAVTARALQNTCNTLAIVPLRARYNAEPVAQVRLAISAALRDLGQCSPSS